MNSRPMSNIDKHALREAAEKATLGRIGDRIDGSGSIKYQCFGNDGSLVLQTDHKNMEYGFIGENSEADELFFRMCDPTTVLALLDELEAAEKRITKLSTERAKGVETLQSELIQARIRAEAAEKRIAELSQKADIYDMLRQDYELHGSLVDFVDWQAKRIAELTESLKQTVSGYKSCLRTGHERILDLGGDCDSPEVMISGNHDIQQAEKLLAAAAGKGE